MLTTNFKAKIFSILLLCLLPFLSFSKTNTANIDTLIECPSSQIIMFSIAPTGPYIPPGVFRPGRFFAVALDCDISNIGFQIKIEQDNDPDYETYIDTIWVSDLEYLTPKMIEFQFPMPDDYTLTSVFDDVYLRMSASVLEESVHSSDTLSFDYPVFFPDFSMTYECPEEFPKPNGVMNYPFTLVNEGLSSSLPTKIGLYQRITAQNWYQPYVDQLFGTKLIPALEPGEVYTDTFTVILPDDFRFPGMAHISGGSHGSRWWGHFYFGLQENSFIEMIDVTCRETNADIALNLSTPSLTYDELGMIEYTVTITNNGPEIAHNILSTVAYTYLGFGGVANILDPNKGDVWQMSYDKKKIWYIDELPRGDTASLKVELYVGPYTYYEPQRYQYSEKLITVSTGSNYIYETISGNNTDQLSFYWENFSQVKTTLNLEASSRAYEYGDEIDFTLTFHNEGPDTGKDFVISFGLPNGLVPVSQDIQQGDYNEINQEWLIDSLPAGETATMLLTGKAKTEDEPLLLFAQVLSSASTDFSNNFGFTYCDFESDIDPYELLYCDEYPHSNGVWVINAQDESLVLIEPISNFQFELPEAQISFGKELQIWPNPVGEELRLQYDFEIPVQKLTLVNIHGQVVKEIANYSENTLPVNDLPKGVYILSLHTAQGIHSRRFVKR